MRWIRVALFLGSVALFVGCILPERGPVLGQAKLVFINHTDSRLCYDGWGAGAVGGSCSTPVKPGGRTVWRPECRSGAELAPARYVKGEPLRVLLAETEGAGELVYDGFGRCDEETTFTIERSGTGFLVSKSVSNPLPTDKPFPTMRP
jgi:hypothetical protein